MAKTTTCIGVSVILLLSVLHISEASIQVIDLERIYQSRPDKYVGLQMRSGLEYPARIQRIPQNQHLCEDNKQWNVTVPESGHPGEYDPEKFAYNSA